MVCEFSESVLDGIADAIVDRGYICIDNLFEPEVVARLRDKVFAEADATFKPASIGRGQEQHRNTDIRRDSIRWLEPHCAVDNSYLLLMESLKNGLNRRLFMGLFDYESHYALYRPGAFYKKHVDALKGSQNRILTTVFFMNPEWQPDHGGVLKLYEEDDSLIEELAPLMGRLVIFLSERFPHEVMPTNVDRASIAGWFRVAGSQHGF
ncbi:2OG-Fe(II) oxygenase [Shewanella litorisediminis]|uniref:2OG-Fe(II) oxygenase n=1 Tax=Shewanella litorisediminis TaxID=1173586 RepID=A0ABX7G8P3_9GAMM|nr:2OG-Fe(II) oxygenase [Shewanella litorisediminis]MCL2916646.1 2OG-Fe(II) oxygenase [Shewanella litorisediminis]QRH03603.1 2OG-Fe(II) oxygenase [Shewanella litorisediminis]